MDKAKREWHDWTYLMFYFQHELEEGEISSTTYESMTNFLMTFKPYIEIEYEKEAKGEDW